MVKLRITTANPEELLTQEDNFIIYSPGAVYMDGQTWVIDSDSPFTFGELELNRGDVLVANHPQGLKNVGMQFDEVVWTVDNSINLDDLYAVKTKIINLRNRLKLLEGS